MKTIDDALAFGCAGLLALLVVSNVLAVISLIWLFFDGGAL